MVMTRRKSYGVPFNNTPFFWAGRGFLSQSLVWLLLVWDKWLLR